MTSCEVCGSPIERLAVRLELAHYRVPSSDESTTDAVLAHHDCGTRAYLELLDWKMKPARDLPAACAPARPGCDLCKELLGAELAEGMLVQLFAVMPNEFRLAAEFGLSGHASCLRATLSQAGRATVAAGRRLRALA
jgi:hypothetical protein